MKVVKPSADYLSKSGLTPTQFIEIIGRTCYKSTNAIKAGSDIKFVKGLVKSKHYAMIEHFWVHCIAYITYDEFMEDLKLFSYFLGMRGGESDLLKHIYITDVGTKIYVSMPIRVAVEMADAINDSPYWDGISVFKFLMSCYDSYRDFFNYHVGLADEKFKFYTEDHFCKILNEDLLLFNDDIRRKELMKHTTHTVKFVCDRGVTHELVRHRPASFAQESQRYCNYTKDKFGGDIQFIEPFFFSRNPETPDNVLYDDSDYTEWLRACEDSEMRYFNLIMKKCTPQEARTVLNNSVKTEIYITANETEWQHIVNLRYHGTTGVPHPQMKEVMSLAYPLLVSNSDNRIK